MIQRSSLFLVLFPAAAVGCAADVKKPVQDGVGDASEGVVGAGGRPAIPLLMGEGGKVTPSVGGGSGGALANGGTGGSGAVAGQGGMPSTDRDAGRSDGMAMSVRDAGAPSSADATGPIGVFECSQFMGPNITAEWFKVFETLGDKAWNEAWQVKAPHASFANLWANPDHEVWKAPVESACPAGKKLERVVFVTQLGSWDSDNVSVWKTAISNGIKTIKVKYPTVKRVELITFYRSTNNKPCPTAKETWVPAAHDEAHALIAAESDGSVTVGPVVKVDCGLYAGPPYLTAAGKKVVADAYYKHYAK